MSNIGVTVAVLGLLFLSPHLSTAQEVPQEPDQQIQAAQNGGSYRGPFWYPDWLWGEVPEGEVYVLRPDGTREKICISPARPSAVEPPVRPSRPQLGEIGKKLVSLDVSRTEAAEAILNLLSAAGANYVIGGEVPTGRKVSAKLKNVPLQEALDALAEAAGLTYTLSGRVIILRPQRLSGMPPLLQIQPPAPPGGVPTSPKRIPRPDEARSRTSARIELHHISPTQAIKLLASRGRGKSGLVAPHQEMSASLDLLEGFDLIADEYGGAVIASGSEQAVRQVERMLRALDVQPPQVQISTSVVSVNASSLSAVRRRLKMPPPTVLGGVGGGITAQSIAPSAADRFLKELKASRALVLAQPNIISIDGVPASLQIDGKGQADGAMNLRVQPRVNADRSITLSLSFGTTQVPRIQPRAGGGAKANTAGGAHIVQRLEPSKVLVVTQPAAAGRGDRRIVLFVRTNVLAGARNEPGSRGIDHEARP
ncbi:MAG: secretin and TonB N-terminal domain-containing protein [Armatimonadota bacterium]